MLSIRFRETFRERMPEWVVAVGMTTWGLTTLNSGDLFTTSKFFHPLLLVMNQTEWGVMALTVGLARLLFLVINGAWRPSAHIRAVGCILGAMLWSNLLIATLSLEWLTPTVAMPATLLFIDIISLWFAAGDAKLADLLAKDRNRIR